MNKPKLLLVDDSPMMTRFLELFLSENYQVTSCLSPVDALDKISHGYTPDMIVTDLQMPEMSGSAFIKAMRKLFAECPIIAISGLKESSSRLKTLEAGADDFVPKPFHPAELKVRIAKLIERKQTPVAPLEQVLWSRDGKNLGFSGISFS
jgi:DNA-binding response OmpR family regulator